MAKTDDEVLIEHAQRCWNAEAENAERLKGRTNLLGTVIVAVASLGLYRVDWFYNPEFVPTVPLWAACTIKTLLILALALFLLALAALFLRSKEERRAEKRAISASELLSLSKKDAEGAIARNVARRVYTAYLELQDRNGIRQGKIQAAMRWFGPGSSSWSWLSWCMLDRVSRLFPQRGLIMETIKAPELTHNETITTKALISDLAERSKRDRRASHRHYNRVRRTWIERLVLAMFGKSTDDAPRQDASIG